jgi:hypothetical protein
MTTRRRLRRLARMMRAYATLIVGLPLLLAAAAAWCAIRAAFPPWRQPR